MVVEWVFRHRGMQCIFVALIEGGQVQVYAYGYHKCSAHPALLVNDVGSHHMGQQYLVSSMLFKAMCISGLMLIWCLGLLALTSDHVSASRIPGSL